jgi:spore germination protein YaaH
MRKRIMPFVVAAVFIFIVAIIAIATMLLEKYTPTKERVVLSEYYKIAEKDDLAIILNEALSEGQCKYIEGHAYLEYSFVNNNLNQRFFWDGNENIMRYTTPTDVITVPADSKEYTITKEKQSKDYVIVKVNGEAVYLAIDFVQEYTNIEFDIIDDSKSVNRILITSKWNEISTTTIRKDTQIREKGGIKSPIVADVKEDDKVIVLDQGDDWSKVSSTDGWIGYIRNKDIGDIEPEIRSRPFDEPEFTHNLKEKKVNMIWHQVTNTVANGEIEDLLKKTKGVNVVSPTWFFLNDNNGNIESLADPSYVEFCHQNNVDVWGLISNLENPDVDSTYILTHTSTRDYLANQIMAKAIENNLDGINLDLESLSNEVGDAYIQFVRELSIKCRKNGIILSVDNYVPSDYTAFYNRAEQAVYADYVVIMGYDEHYAGGEKEGSVASINFVTKGVKDTLAEVPANQTILAMPFYTRLWMLTPKGESDTVEAASENYVPYTLESRAISMREAEQLYSDSSVEKKWLEEEGQYYVEYVVDGITHKLWLEDERSMEERLKVLNASELAGGAFWKLGLEKENIWDLIVKYIN